MALDIIADEVVWAQKYRPQTVADVVLPAKTKAIFQKYVDDRSVPDLLLVGSPGVGKTTVAKAMLNQLGCDFIVINGSLNGGIDTLRNEIQNFASSISFMGGRKYAIIDEADGLSAANQNAMRSFMDTYSKNCGFIFTGNFLNRIIDPVRSRFTLVDFTVDKSERPKLAAQFFKRALAILEHENVTYDAKVVAKVVELRFPDFRRVLNNLQRYSTATGHIDEGVFNNIKHESLEVLFGFLKEKKFTDMRKWVAENSDQDTNEMFRLIYDMATDKVELKSLPGFVVELADYMYKHAFVADPEINMVAFLTTVMMESTFK